MAGNSDNIFVGAVNAVYYTTAGATLPTSLANWETIKASWTAAGLVSEDGISESPSWDTNDIKDSDGNICRVIKTSDALEYGLAFLETTDATEDFVLGGHAHPGTPHNVTGAMPAVRAIVIDTRDPARVQQRLIVIPRGQVKEQKERVYSAADSVKWGATVTAYKDTNGNKAQIFRGAYV